MRSSWTACVPPSTGGGGGACSGSGSGSMSMPSSLSLANSTTLRVSGVGSCHRSRKTVSTSWTAGPLIAAIMSCQGGVSPYSLGQALHRLRVAVVLDVVAAGVAQVDAADVRHVAGRVVRVADHHELLVVRATHPHPHVEQRLGAPRLELLAEAAVHLGGEAEQLGVRPPHQAPHVHPALVGPGEHLDDLAALLAGEPLVGVALPVGEEDEVAGPGPLEALEQLGEVRRAVHQRPHQVAVGPGLVAGVVVVERGARVAAILLAQHPVGGVGHAA